jgi:hypothetical protein
MIQYVIQTKGHDGRWYFTIGGKPTADKASIERQVDAGNRAGYQYRIYEFSGDLLEEQIRVAEQYRAERAASH